MASIALVIANNSFGNDDAKDIKTNYFLYFADRDVRVVFENVMLDNIIKSRMTSDMQTAIYHANGRTNLGDFYLSPRVTNAISMQQRPLGCTVEYDHANNQVKISKDQEKPYVDAYQIRLNNVIAVSEISNAVNYINNNLGREINRDDITNFFWPYMPKDAKKTNLLDYIDALKDQVQLEKQYKRKMIFHDYLRNVSVLDNGCLCAIAGVEDQESHVSRVAILIYYDKKWRILRQLESADRGVVEAR